MKKIFLQNKTKGIALVEVVIGTTIIVTGIIGLINAYTIYVKYALANDKNIQAAYLAEEGLEAMGYLRDYGWVTKIAPLSAGTTYYLTWNSAQALWDVTTSPQYVDGVFLRKISLESVYRDANDMIAVSGALDQNTKKLTVTLEYSQAGATTTKTMTTYLTNLYAN